jgi:hypothetical protein
MASTETSFALVVRQHLQAVKEARVHNLYLLLLQLAIPHSTVHVTLSQLAQKTGISITTVKRYLKAIAEQKPWLSFRPAGRAGIAIYYRPDQTKPQKRTKKSPTSSQPSQDHPSHTQDQAPTRTDLVSPGVGAPPLDEGMAPQVLHRPLSQMGRTQRRRPRPHHRPLHLARQSGIFHHKDRCEALVAGVPLRRQSPPRTRQSPLPVPLRPPQRLDQQTDQEKFL